MAEQCSSTVPRRIRLGMIGGGPGGFIGAVHRVAAALTSDAERSRAAAAELHIPRAYGDF
jgi:predicted dehydrogenase